MAQIITIGIGSLFVHLSRFRYSVMRYPGSAWTSPDPNQIQFWTSGAVTMFRYLCVIQDPSGLNQTRSDPPPAKQIGTKSGISTQSGSDGHRESRLTSQGGLWEIRPLDGLGNTVFNFRPFTAMHHVTCSLSEMHAQTLSFALTFMADESGHDGS